MTSLLENVYNINNKVISCDLFKAKHRLTKNSFNRSRKPPFPILLTYFLNLTKGSYQLELDNFFAVTNSSSRSSQFRLPNKADIIEYFGINPGKNQNKSKGYNGLT